MKRGKRRKSNDAPRKRRKESYQEDEFCVAGDMEEEQETTPDWNLTPFVQQILVYRPISDYSEDPEKKIRKALGDTCFSQLSQQYLDELNTGGRTLRRRPGQPAATATTNAPMTAADLWQAADNAERAARAASYSKAILQQKVTQDQMARNNLNALFLHVGQGDCTFIQTPGMRRILIDCGSTGGIEDCGQPAAATGWRGVRDHIMGCMGGTRQDLDILIFSHPDRDHHNGFIWLSNQCFSAIKRVFHSNNMGNYVDNKIVTSQYIRDHFPKNQQAIKRTRRNADGCTVGGEVPPNANRRAGKTEWVDQHGALVILEEPNCTVRILASEVLLDEKKLRDAHQCNRASVITLIEAYGKKILVCGDATSEAEDYVLRKYGANLLAGPVDIVRCSHHGSDEDCNHQDFTRALQAETVIVSAAQDSLPNHGLPAIAVIARFWEHVASEDAKHNVWFWRKDPDKTRVNDNLYDTDLYSDTDRGPLKKKKLWTTGSSGTIIRSFANPNP